MNSGVWSRTWTTRSWSCPISFIEPVPANALYGGLQIHLFTWEYRPTGLPACIFDPEGWVSIRAVGDGPGGPCTFLWMSHGSDQDPGAGSLSIDPLDVDGDGETRTFETYDLAVCLFECKNCPLGDPCPSFNIDRTSPGSEFAIDFADLSIVLGHWGPCTDPTDPCQVANLDSTFSPDSVGLDDLALILGFWGICVCP